MGITWQDLSEISMGYVLQKTLPATSINAEKICEPYPKGIQLLQGKKNVKEDEIIEAIGLQPYSAAMQAATDGKITPAQSVVLLEKAYARADAAKRLEKELKRLRLGEDADLSPIQAILDDMKNCETRMVRMSDIEPDETPLIECGWDAIDKYLGGIPEIGVTLVAGPPGSGKTSFAAKILAKWVKRHKKKAAYFSLELTNEQIVARSLQMEKLTKKDTDLIYLCDKVEDVEDLATVISKLDGVSLVVVDFAELVIPGEASESTMSAIYRKLLWTAKNLGIPIIVLSQMNRKYDGAVPVMTMVKYAGEQLSRLVLLIYNPESVLVSPADAEMLPPFPGESYLVVGKSTFKLKEKGLGAIRVAFRADTGFSDTAVKWHPLGSPPKRDIMPEMRPLKRKK